MRKKILAILMAAILMATSSMVFAETEIPEFVVENSEDDGKAEVTEGNLLQNPSFEDVENYKPLHWENRSNLFGTAFEWGAERDHSVVNHMKRTGKNSLVSLHGSSGWIRQKVELEQGATYQFSAWFQLIETAGNASGKGTMIDVEFYDKNGKYISDSATTFEMGNIGQWYKSILEFTAPEGVAYGLFYLGNAMMYALAVWDDVCLIKAGEPARASLYGVDIIGYTDQEEDMRAEVVLNRLSYSYEEGHEPVVDIFLKDGDDILKEQLQTPLKGRVNFTYPVSLLEEKLKDYTVEAVIYESAGGAEWERYSYKVMRVDWPKRLTKDGMYIKEDGSEMIPVISWHVHWDQYEKAAKTGVNVVQSHTVQQLKKQLDLAQKAGIMVMVQLYGGTPRLTEDNKLSDERIATFTGIIDTVRDHPATFGYLLEDEPYMWSNTVDIGEHMRLRFQLIREMDEEHPILLVEQDKKNGYYPARCADMFVYDDYPLPSRGINSFGNSMKTSIEAVGREKPVNGLMQIEAINAGYLPKIYEIRNMAYQSVFRGGAGWSYYGMDALKKVADEGLDLDETWPLYQDLVGFKTSGEINMIHDAFVLEKWPTLTESIGGDVWYKAWVDGKDIKLVALNITGEEKTVEIPLVGGNGKVKIGSFKGTLLYGDSDIKEIEGDGTAKITLGENRVSVYTITPDTMPDTAVLKEQKFADLENHPWAYDAIEKMWKKGILPETGRRTYSPAQNVTRAEFAAMLIDTLGLTATEIEQFADVENYMYYADELAIGKALGVLNGVGDEKYNPNAEISRQDLMAICARGMRLIKDLGEGGEMHFTDKDLIASYAAMDIAAMVSANIVKGNADGTINPQGNATRAEVAVIMDRIATWKGAEA